MGAKATTTEHFEVSFLDENANRRTALAHNESDAQALAKKFNDENLKAVQLHRITTTRQAVL